MIPKNELISLSPSYKKFNKLRESILSIDPEEWTISHALAYMMFLYKQKFGVDYVLSYDSPSISGSYEYKLMNRLFGSLGVKACQGELIKLYLIWFFENYSSPKGFRSVGALIRPDSIAKFVNYQKQKETPTVNSMLQQKYLDILSSFENTSYIKTYGDLYYMTKSLENSKDPNKTQILFSLIVLLEKAGLSRNTLNNLS